MKWCLITATSAHKVLGSSMRRWRFHLQFGLAKKVLNRPKLKRCQHLS
jgi:hypothetical protein